MSSEMDSANKSRMRWSSALKWLCLAALLGGLAMGLRSTPMPVETAVARIAPMEVSVLEEGKTRIRSRFVISATVAGMLRRTRLRAGDRVQAGETVVGVIDAEPAELLNPRVLKQAEAKVQSAAAALQQRETDLARARDSADLAERERLRAEALAGSGAISEKERDATDLAATMRTRELKAAEFSRDIARYELAQADAVLHNGVTGSAALLLKSPVNGVVLNILEENERPVLPGTPLLELGDPNDLEAEIELLSTDAAGVQPGAPVRIERWGGPEPLQATVRRIEPAAFTKTSALGVEEQRVRVLADFTDPLPQNPTLGDRFRIEGRIQTWRSDSVLQVPAGAVFRRGPAWHCFVFEAGIARLKTVELGHQNNESAEVRVGLAAGEKVIVHPPDAIQDGSRIVERP